MSNTTASSAATDMLGVGVDVGNRRARVARLGPGEDGEVCLLGAAMIPIPESAGKPANLRELAKQAGIKGNGAHCNLSPAMTIVHEVEFPGMDEGDLGSAVRIEAEQLIPDIDSMVLDYQVLARLASEEGKPSRLKAMIVAAPKDAVDERADWLASTGLDARAVTPDGLAIANAILALRPPGARPVLRPKGDPAAPLSPGARPVMALDIGANATSLVAVSMGEDIAAPTVRFVRGGADLLRDEEDSEENHRLKERWLSEVERTIAFVAQRFGDAPDCLLVLGEATESPEAINWIESNLYKETEAWNCLAELPRGPDAPDEEWVREHGAHFAVAVGLAVMEGC